MLQCNCQKDDNKIRKQRRNSAERFKQLKRLEEKMKTRTKKDVLEIMNKMDVICRLYAWDNPNTDIIRPYQNRIEWANDLIKRIGGEYQDYREIEHISRSNRKPVYNEWYEYILPFKYYDGVEGVLNITVHGHQSAEEEFVDITITELDQVFNKVDKEYIIW